MSKHHLPIAALIIVVLVAPVAALLLVAALVVWMAELMGSVIYPALLLGVLLALLAYVVYRVSLRDALREMDEQWRAVSQTVALIREGVEWCVRQLLGK